MSTFEILDRQLRELRMNIPGGTSDLLGAIGTFRENAKRIILELPFVITNRDLPSSPGLYFLVRDGEIMYIGQSHNIKKRWMARRDFRASDINHIHYIADNALILDLNALEGLLVFLFVPRYNRSINNKVNFFAWDSVQDGGK